MALESSNTLATKHIPDLLRRSATGVEYFLTQEHAYLALEVIVTSEEQPSRHGEGNRGNTANGLANLNVCISKPDLKQQSRFERTEKSERYLSENGKTYRVCLELPVCTNIEQAARSIVGAGSESIAVGEKLDGVDVGIVSSKGLDALLLADIPELSKGIASTGDELIGVQRVYAQAHDIAQMVCKLVDLGTRLEIPKHARHVTRGRENLSVADESTAAEVARVTGQLSRHTSRAFASRQVVD